MLSKRLVVALVPARGGSKGLPRKNLISIANRTLVEITLQAAIDAKLVDKVYLSSDDEEILNEGRKLEVMVLKRPLELASDDASANDVVKHFIHNSIPDIQEHDPYLVYLQPTSPMRMAKHIDEALTMMSNQCVHSAISVVELTKSPFKTFSLDNNGRLQSLFDESLTNARRQDLPKTYMPNGAIYIFRVSDFIAHGSIPSNGSIPFIMSEVDSIDIDTEDDIRKLRLLLGIQNG